MRGKRGKGERKRERANGMTEKDREERSRLGKNEGITMRVHPFEDLINRFN